MKAFFTILFLTAFFCIKSNAQSPANDSCSGAIQLNCGGSYTGDNTNATDDFVSVSYQGNNFNELVTKGVWFTYTAPASGTITISLNQPLGNRVFDVYSGSCNSFALNGSSYPSNTDSFDYKFNVTAGTTYYALLGSGGDSGPYTISLTCNLNLPPANDNCSGAVALTCGGSYTGDNTYATDDMPRYLQNGNNSTISVFKGSWFSYTATATGKANFKIIGKRYVVPIFSGNCDSLAPVIENLTNYNDSFTSVEVNVTSGTTYHILFGMFKGTETGGAYTIKTSCVCAPHITSQPRSAGYCQGSAITPLSVLLDGYVASLKWYSNSIKSTKGGKLVNSGFGTATFSSSDSIYTAYYSNYTPLASTPGATYYYAVATGSCGSDTSAIVAVTVNPSLIASISAQQTAICYGSKIQLTATAQGGANPYQYSFINIDSSTSTAFGSARTASKPAGSYAVSIRDNIGCIDTSNTVTITQPASAIVISSTVKNGVCGGKGSATVSATGGYGSFVYQINSSSETGKGSSYTFRNLIQGSYTVTAIDANGCSKSKNITIGNTNTVPAPANFTGPTTVAAGSTVAYNVDAIDGVTYTWAVPSDAIVASGQGTASVTITWGYKAGNIKITPTSSCGSGPAKQYSIIVTHANDAMATTLPKANTSVFPNPAADIATVTFTAEKENKYALTITDMRGKQVMHKEINSVKGVNRVKLAVSNFTDGMYVITLSNGTAVENLKLLKAK